VNLSAKGYETLLPTYRSVRKWSDRTKTLSFPLFPGYVFCRFDVNSRLPILMTPGVNGIVVTGNYPTAVNEIEIEALRVLMVSRMPAAPVPYVRSGDLVRVEEGALKGLTGIIVRQKGAERLIVSVKLLMRSVSIEVDRSVIQILHSSSDQRVPETDAYEGLTTSQSEAGIICQ
jgi:transcription antitermination factor NusG